MNKKITLICARTFTVVKFRKGLVEALKNENYDVSIIALDDDYKDEIIKWGVEFYSIKQNNRSINPFEKLKLINQIRNILLAIKPDKVFTFMLTPNTFGVFGGKKANINNIYSMVEGLGDVFIYDSIKWKIVRFITCVLLKKSFRNVKKVFFINEEDKNELVRRNIVDNKKCVVINGVGIDTNYFSYKPINNYNTFVLIARLMPSKGILEYCKAARIVKEDYPNTVFNLIGEEFTLTIKDIKEYIDDGTIVYKGYQEDIRPFVENCYMNILPSYREGFGLVIAEVGAMGRASIASNTQGCKDAIIENKTGLLFENKNYIDLANKIKYALNNTEEINKMSLNAYELAKTKYNKDVINKIILNEIYE